MQNLLYPLEINTSWTDVGIATVNGGQTAASVDLVLPMVDDPRVFGRIVVTHVLSDLYAAGAAPIFALNIVGVPGDGPQDDEPTMEMLASAAEELHAQGCTLIGGHTIENDQLFYGLAAVGQLGEIARSPGGGQSGELLVLTKPLGTSVATESWKSAEVKQEQFHDVVKGMLAPNATSSSLFGSLGVTTCTDVTGFGFLGHLTSILEASSLAATVSLSGLPIYDSVRAWPVNRLSGTRLFEMNEDAMLGRVREEDVSVSTIERVCLFDAQVSGGLLAAVDPNRIEELLDRADQLGQSCWVVGELVSGPTGQIELVR